MEQDKSNELNNISTLEQSDGLKVVSDSEFFEWSDIKQIAHRPEIRYAAIMASLHLLSLEKYDYITVDEAFEYIENSTRFYPYFEKEKLKKYEVIECIEIFRMFASASSRRENKDAPVGYNLCSSLDLNSEKLFEKVGYNYFYNKAEKRRQEAFNNPNANHHFGTVNISEFNDSQTQ